MIKCILCFILGVGIGMIIMSCLAIAKECDKNERENKENK